MPGSIQEKAPKGVEDSLPDNVHDTGSGGSGKDSGMDKSHATDENASKVPKGIQKIVPESLERALPESIHPTGDKKA